MRKCSGFGPLVEDTDNDAAAGTIIDPWLSIGTSLLCVRWGRCRVRAAVSIRSRAATTAAWSEPDAVASRSEAMGPEPHARWEARSVTTVCPLLAALARAAFPPPVVGAGAAATEEAGVMLFIVPLYVNVSAPYQCIGSLPYYMYEQWLASADLFFFFFPSPSSKTLCHVLVFDF